jgi:hypothetical protein
MNKAFIYAFAIFFLLPSIAFAQSPQGNQIQKRDMDTVNPSAPQGSTVQNQNNSLGEIEEERGSLMRSFNARMNMSEVAKRVEELLGEQGAKGGIGEQVRVIAQQQKQAQAQILEGMDRLEIRSKYSKSIIGPDYKAIGSLNRQIEHNRVRIQVLEQLANEAQNQAEEDQLREVIQILKDQNTSLQLKVDEESSIKSPLGWLFRLFAR